jgi:hypothetical protein
MEEKRFFSNTFKRQTTPDGSPMYWFLSCYTQDDTTHNEKPYLSVDGAIYYSESDQLVSRNNNQLFTVLPEETRNPEVHKKVFETWLRDCSGTFVKPPTLTQCLANTTSIWDSNAPVATINPTEEDSDWILQWVPTKLKVCMPTFQIYWAPCYKTQSTRIPDLFNTVSPPNATTIPDTIELQQPEKIYTITRLNEQPPKDEWLQELTDLSLPYTDSPTLRFDPSLDRQRDKFRRRVRDARIRVKLARYRAERLAQQFEEKYGTYPEEDEEEGQTEAEQSDED